MSILLLGEEAPSKRIFVFQDSLLIFMFKKIFLGLSAFSSLACAGAKFKRM